MKNLFSQQTIRVTYSQSKVRELFNLLNPIIHDDRGAPASDSKLDKEPPLPPDEQDRAEKLKEIGTSVHLRVLEHLAQVHLPRQLTNILSNPVWSTELVLTRA